MRPTRFGDNTPEITASPGLGGWGHFLRKTKRLPPPVNK